MKALPALHTAFLLLFVSTVGADDKILLRPHFEVGKTYNQETLTDLNMMVPGLGDTGGQKTNMMQTMAVTVTKDAASENKLAEIKFTAIKGTVGMMGQNMAFDSTDPAKSSPFLQQTFGALVGKSFTLVYDKDDKFLSVRDDGKAPTPLGQTKAMNSEKLAEAFRKTQEMALPSAPVAVGDTWTYDDAMDMPPIGKIMIKANGKFDSVLDKDGHKQARLLIDGKFETPAGDAASQLVKFADGSKFTGEIFFDLDRKVVTSSEIKSDLKLSIAGKEAPLTQSVLNRLVSIVDAK